MNNIYYLSIKKTSLSHYIKKAIILPSRFYDNRGVDIQSKFGDYLFLSRTPYVEDSNCSIELVLTKNEIDNLKKIDSDIFLFDKPIPISRIKHIYFCTDEEKKLPLGNIHHGVGYVNNNIIKIVEKTDECISKITIPKIEDFKYLEDLESKIKEFDQKLGGIAFVRFNTHSKYSENYFSILSFFNKLIKDEYEINNSNKTTNKYDGAFNDDAGFWGKLRPLIYKPITEADVNKVAQEEKINIKEGSAGIFEFTKIDKKTKTYKLAVLCTYGDSGTKRKSIDNLVSDLESIDRQEGISLIFGINNGYSVFHNKYKEKIVKFKMDSMLDYYTIESVFQHTINDKHNCHKFEYLDKIICEKPLIDDLYYETYHILDETVITDTKTIISEIKDSEMLNPSLHEKITSFIKKIKDKLSKKVKDLEAQNNEIKKSLEEEQANVAKLKRKTIKPEKIKESQPIKNSNFINNEKFHSMTVEELKKYAKDNGIKYLSKDKKNELISKIKQSLPHG